MAPRDLPPGAALAEQIATALSGRAHVVARGAWPVAFISVGDRVPLSLLDYPSSAWLAMPDGPSWTLATRADWEALLPALRAAITSYSALEPRPIALGDVAVAIAETLDRVVGAPWTVSAGGRPSTSELFFERGSHRVRLRRDGRAIHVDVFMQGGRSPRSTEVASAIELGSIAAVVERQLGSVTREVAALAARRDAEAEARRARTDRAFAGVLAALHRGERFVVRGGRWSETYFVAAGRLRCERFDEGDVSVLEIDEETLRRAIDGSPDAFVRRAHERE